MSSAHTPTSPVKGTTWSAWFSKQPSAETINKSAQESLFQAFNVSVNAADCKQAVMNHQESAFLLHDAFGNNRVAIFHHLVQQGGTVYDATTHYGMVLGIEKAMAINVTPDDTVLFEVPAGPATPIPKTTDLLGVTTEADITNLQAGSTTTYRARNFIPIVPFLLDDINSAIVQHNGNAKEVYLAVVRAIKNFDNVHSSDAAYSDKARQKCRDCLAWLYLVATGNGAVSKTPTTGCNNVGVITKLNAITNLCLSTSNKRSPTRSVLAMSTQIQSNLQKPLEVIAASTSSNQDFLRKLTQMHEASEDKSSKSFKKLPKKYQNMLLVASSVNEATVTEINANAAEFFSASSTLNASILLNSLLEGERIDCSISNAMANSLHHGSLLWINSVTPSGLACCVITTEDFMRNDTLYDGLVLDYATKFEMNPKDLDKLTKTQVKFPKDIEETIDRFRALEALCKLFFGRRSLPAQGLRGLVLKCQDNRRLLKSTQHHDLDFIAKFMCAVDHRLYQWLQQCSQAQSVDDTSIALLDYSSLFDDIMMHRFHYILPLSVKKITPHKRDTTKDNDGEKDKKRARKVAMVRNDNVPPEWKLRQGESWDNVFRNKTMEGPTLSMGCKFCLKFWVKGVCYEDCKQKDSHGELTDDDKVAARNFIAELRGEAQGTG